MWSQMSHMGQKVYIYKNMNKWQEERRWKSISNPLSTFCYLSAQRDAFGQLVDGQLTVEVTLLGWGANLDNNHDGYHDGDEKEAHTVDDHLQVGVVGWGVLCHC